LKKLPAKDFIGPFITPIASGIGTGIVYISNRSNKIDCSEKLHITELFYYSGK